MLALHELLLFFSELQRQYPGDNERVECKVDRWKTYRRQSCHDGTHDVENPGPTGAGSNAQ